MAITLTAVFAYGREESIRDYDNMLDAVDAALMLADSHGCDPAHGSGAPHRFHVLCEGRLELSIRVIRGGLAGLPNPRKRAVRALFAEITRA